MARPEGVRPAGPIHWRAEGAMSITTCCIDACPQPVGMRHIASPQLYLLSRQGEPWRSGNPSAAQTRP